MDVGFAECIKCGANSPCSNTTILHNPVDGYLFPGGDFGINLVTAGDSTTISIGEVFTGGSGINGASGITRRCGFGIVGDVASHRQESVVVEGDVDVGVIVLGILLTTLAMLMIGNSD